MAAASIAVQLGAQIADFKAKFTEASRTTERFAADFKGSAETVEKLQQRLNKAFQDFSGDKIASQAQKMASAITAIGGASKLTEAEQQRVNRTVTEAIAKYQAMGQQAPQALQELARATQAIPIDELAADTERLTRQFGGAGLQSARAYAEAVKSVGGVSKLTQAEQKQVNVTVTEAIAKYRALGKEAPADLRALAAATQKVVDPTEALRQRLDGLKSSLASFGSTARSIGVGLSAGITAPLAAISGLSVKAAIDFESSFAGVRKTVDATTSELDAMSLGIRKLAKEMPLSVNEINKVAEAAGALGVKKDDILTFTKTMVQLGATTNLSADEAATAMARFANIMGTPLSAVQKLGNALVDLGNNGASTEREIVDMALKIASAGKAVGFTEGQVLGMANALSSLGLEAEAGGTAISKAMINMAASVSQGGVALDAIAKVALPGVTNASQQFAERFRTDAAGAMTLFIAGLNKVKDEGGDLISVLASLDITEVRLRDTMLRVAQSGTLVADSIKRGNEQFQSGTALTSEYGKRVQTAQSQLQVFRNRLSDVAITFGGQLVPLLLDAVRGFERFIPIVERAVTAFANLPEPVRLTALALAGIGIAAGPVLIGIGQLSLGLSGMVPLLGKMTVEAGKTTQGLASFGPALRGAGASLATVSAPLTALGLAFTGVIGIVKDFERDFATGMKSVLGIVPGFDLVRGAVDRLGNAFPPLGRVIESISTIITNSWVLAWDKASTAINITARTVRESLSVFDPLSAALQRVGDSITRTVIPSMAGLVTAVGLAIGPVRDLLFLLSKIPGLGDIQKALDQVAQGTRRLAAAGTELQSAMSPTGRSWGGVAQDFTAAFSPRVFGAATKVISDVEKGIAAASERTKQYNADLAKMAAGTSAKQLADDFKVTQDTIERLGKSVTSVKKAEHDRAKQVVDDAKHVIDSYEDTRKAFERFHDLVSKADLTEPFEGLEKAAQVNVEAINRVTLGVLEMIRAIDSVPALTVTGLDKPKDISDTFVAGGKNLEPEFPQRIRDQVIGAFQEVTGKADGLAQSLSSLSDVTESRAVGALQDLFVSITNANNAGKQLAAGWAEMREKGGSLMSGLLQMAQGVIAGIASIAQSTSRGNTGSRVAGGALSGAALGTSILPGWGTTIGAVAGALTGLIRGMNQGRSAVKDFAESFGGFDALHERLLELGDAGEALWVRLTQGISRGDAKGATDAIAAIEDALAKGKTAAKSFEDEFAAAGFKTRDQLAETASQAVSLYERMRDSGKFTAADIARAFEQAQEAIRAATGDTAQLESMDRIKAKIGELSTEYDSLFKAVSNEAPEEEMGVIEKQMRERLSAIGEERGTLEAQLKTMTEDLQSAFGLVGQAAQTAAQEIVDAFAGVNVTVPFNPSGLQKTASAATDTADKVVTTFANAKVDIPVNDRVFDTLGTSVRDAAQHVQDTFADLNLTLPVNPAAFDALGVSASSVAGQITSTFADLRLAIPVDATSFEGLGTAARDAADRITGVFADLDLTIPVNAKVFEVLGTAARDAGADISLTFSRVETTIPLNNRMFEPLEHAARNTADNIEQIFSDLRITIPVSLSMDGLEKLGSGGIIKEPTLALLGESGPEAVIPLDSGFMPEPRPIIVQSYLDGKLVAENTARHLPGVLHRRGV